MRQEYPVVRIEEIEGTKIHGSSAQKSFSAAIIYVLEDGRRIGSHCRRSKKKEVVAYLAKLPLEPKDMKVTLSEDGRIESTIQSLSGIMGW
jgi:hypothetical protein